MCVGCVRVCMVACVWCSAYVCLCTCMHVCVRGVHVCVYVYACVCVCVCVCVIWAIRLTVNISELYRRIGVALKI